MTIENGRAWPADRVERRALAGLVPYARNARLHSPQQIDQLVASMQQFGWTIPVLIDEGGEVIAGHGRLLAAARLGLDEAPVMVARGWSEAQKRAYRIADNKLSLNASWDAELLAAEIGLLHGDGFDLSVVGFSDAELQTLLNGWSSDIDVREHFGAHTDGITVTLKVEVAQAEAEVAKTVIAGALEQAGIRHAIN